MAHWIVARSEPQREAVAASFLGKAGYATYLPRIRETRVNHGRRIVTAPCLFPSYIFVRIELQWHSARWTIGVSGLIMSGDAPAPVADAIVDAIKVREQGGFVVLDEKRGLRPGDPIRVTGGLLIGATGLYSGMRGADRVAVLLTALGVAVLPTAAVERA
jgi:transcription antitermination factor NusG